MKKMEAIKTKSVKGRKPSGSKINFIVESNVKMFKDRLKPTSIYPYFKMNVGDSFEFPSSMYGRIHASSWYHSKKHGVKFVMMQQDNEKHRIWRTK
jgi:hypothetical protein